MNFILTVCIGNICRSPMAAGLLEEKFPGSHVVSAGISALIGQAADPLAISLMQAKGIDISKHVAQQINQLLCQKADIILVMDSEQRRYIERLYPFARGKVFRIAESIKSDVPDPYGRDYGAFEIAFELIQQGVSSWTERILKITQQDRLIK